MLFIRQKQKKIRNTKTYLNETMFEEPWATKVNVLIYFYNLRWLNNSGIILELMLHHTIDHILTFIHWLIIHLIFITLTILAQPPEQNSEAAAGGVALVLEPLFLKFASLQACNVIKKRLLQRCFPVKFEKFLRTRFCVLIT